MGNVAIQLSSVGTEDGVALSSLGLRIGFVEEGFYLFHFVCVRGWEKMSVCEGLYRYAIELVEIYTIVSRLCNIIYIYICCRGDDDDDLVGV